MALAPPPELLRGRRLVLASASPRRKWILGLAGVAFDVIPCDRPEAPSRPGAEPVDHAREAAAAKAVGVAERLFREEPEAPWLVIGADTVVAVDGEILGKPCDHEDNVRMLLRLSGQTHSVVTGVALVTPGEGSDRDPAPHVLCFHEETRVTFSRISEALARDMADGGEGRDAAGGYKLQGRGGLLAERVDGDFLCAVGFPLNRFLREVGRLPPPGGRK